ncbi:MAG: hypothetical protein M3500_01330 [Actinomycetota bacterium]|nr:hypothetical protein [Actinomycetota bacterium]
MQRHHADEIAPLEERYERTREARTLANARVNDSHLVIAAETVQLRDVLLADWNARRGDARANAQTVLDGPGRLGLKWAAVNRANEALASWSVSWQPIIPTMPTGHADIARFADRTDDVPRIYAAVDDYARRQAEVSHPEHKCHIAQATAAHRAAVRASGHLHDTRGRHRQELGYYGRLGETQDPDERLAQIERQIASRQQRLTSTRERITHLERSLASAQNEVRGQAERITVSPLGLGQPADAVQAARTQWSAEHAVAQQAARREAAHRQAAADIARDQERRETWRRHEPSPTVTTPDHGIGR